MTAQHGLNGPGNDCIGPSSPSRHSGMGGTDAIVPEPARMRFAYADPPYPGQAKRWYGKHPDYGGEVDHALLIDRLYGDYPDGWALSTSAAALQGVLMVCPLTVRVAIWYRPNSEPPGNRGRWHWSWEPLIVQGGRQKYGDAPAVRDVLMAGKHSGFLHNQISGQKPPAFCRWVFGLLGALPGDQLDDLFPGSGAIGKAWREYASQPWMEP